MVTLQELGTRLMTQGASDSPIGSQETSSHQGLLGVFPAGGTAGYRLDSTGTLHDLPEGGSVAVCGRPRFQDAELEEVAAADGCAAALAQGYTEHSTGIFSRMRGAFSCVIIDTRQQRVLSAIDRLGQHSLYYSETEGVLAFGSSAGGVMSCIPGELNLARQGVYNYLYFHMVPCPDTIYDNLHKLCAAHYLDYRAGECRLVNYWLPAFGESINPPTLDSLCADLKAVLRSSVERGLQGAGKAGSFLSGGLDSSTVTGVLAEVSGGGAEAYSIGFSAEGYDEMAFARITARHFGVKLNEYYVTPQDVVDALPLIATRYDEPFGNSSALPAYFCAKMARESGVDTLLAGDGGDEIFAGNERYIKQRAFDHYERIPSALRSALLEPLVNALPASVPLVPKARSYIEQAKTPLPDRLQSYNFLHRHPIAEIFRDEFLAAVDPQAPLELLRTIFRRPEQASDLNRMLYLDWQITLADNDLRKVSHMCELAGIGVTYPMLDDELVELSCRVPSKLKIKGSNLRHFFKHALNDWLPQETINKSKQGFGLPFGVWMQTYEPLREMAYDNLLALKAREFIRPEFIDRTIGMHQSDHAAYYGELVWILTVFELWMSGLESTHREDAQ